MKQVEDHQHKLDEVRENYTYHETVITHELDKNGNIKKNESEENNVFFVNGHEINRRVKKNGKELNADEQKKNRSTLRKKSKSLEDSSRAIDGQEQKVSVLACCRS